MNSALPKIVISTGEPAGIGPDITLLASQHEFNARLSVVGDPILLEQRAKQMNMYLEFSTINNFNDVGIHKAGKLCVMPVAINEPVSPGLLNLSNSKYVVNGINKAIEQCISGQAHAMVTAPVHKSVINDAGIPFSGHTEWIAEKTEAAQPVMMLANKEMRVCLLTTHLPLAKVPKQITADRLFAVIGVMNRDIKRLYGISNPRIGICGLNPHAGEGGYLGREEIDVIEPVIKKLQSGGMNLIGPIPADTAFTKNVLTDLDAVLAMYHDQGLPVVKHSRFGEVVNVTLGLPIIRTSVDHGTALDLAGTGLAKESSLVAAINLAIDFCIKQQKQS